MSVQFHLFDAVSQDMYEENGSEKKDSYYVHLFGSSVEGKTIRLSVSGFQPFFYVELPTVKGALSELKMRLDKSVEVNHCKKIPLYGYSGGKPKSLVEIRCRSRKIFYNTRKIFLDERSRPILQLYIDSEPLKVYDAMLDPMLRMFHLRKIQPCGWVEANVDLEEEDDILIGTCDWEDISPVAKPPAPTAPLLMNFWDIECYNANGDFPVANKGDPIIQIGNVYVRQGSEPDKHIFVLGTCDPVPGATVHAFKNEKDMLLAWMEHLVEKNPDILSGYNTSGFDEKYVWERAVQLGITDAEGKAERQKVVLRSFNRLSVMPAQEKESMKLNTKFLSSSALGDNYLYTWNATGRLLVDLYQYVRRTNTSLPSYKLDSVCEHYLSGKLSGVDTSKPGEWVLKIKQTGDVHPGRYIVLLDENGEALVEKMKVLSVEPGKSVVVIAEGLDEEDMSDAMRWVIVKDDVPPAEIFRLHREEGAAGRARVAAYCIQDCDLVYELYKKLDVFNNAMSMANVCSVPISYIFSRGQGIKIESLIFKECHERGMVVEVLDSPPRPGTELGDIDDEAKESETYEGAIVLDPVPGFYSESPIGVCDFASLYPSTIISEDISHDSLVWVKDFDMAGKFIRVSYGRVADELNAPEGTRWTDISFDIWKPDPNDKRKTPEKIKTGLRVCRYAQKPDGSKHTLPDIVAKLLAARKSKRKEAEKEPDPFRKALLDAEQLAYKLTANSLYGQIGSSTFKARLVNLAASVTAYGRCQILFAKAAIEKFYGPEAKDPRCSASVMYGDTDSLFVDFGVKDPATGKKLSGTAAVEATMKITEEAGKFVSSALKPPHDFEYDKVFDQFIIFSKKRYVGNKYEESATDFKQTAMGIVLRRRDNAPILKTIYGGAIKILLNERDVTKAARFVTDKTLEMIEGKISMSQLIITKSLSMYKRDWIKKDINELEEKLLNMVSKSKVSESLELQLKKKQDELENAPPYPAHKMLAERMAERDSGNAPSSGERMGYVYISAAAGQLAPKLQGDRIESVDYIKAKGLLPDYQYYIEHQLMKPIGQLFGIMVEKIPGCPPLPEASDGKRESLAIDLLFGKALNACDKKATRNFMEKQFGVTVVPSTTASKASGERYSARIAEAASKPKQTSLDTYFLTKMIVNEYDEQKKKEKKTATEAAEKKDKKKKK
jgi:DNA polymerase elongation subunit (family B)